MNVKLLGVILIFVLSFLAFFFSVSGKIYKIIETYKELNEITPAKLERMTKKNTHDRTVYERH